jgi:sec-independent protein translocase protein TatC
MTLLARPLMIALPEGTKMIATGVVTPFFVPVKVTLMLAFLIALPVVLYQAWAFIAPGLYAHERRLGLPLVIASTLLFMTRHGLLLLPRVRGGFPVHCRVRAQKHHSGT